MTNSSLPFHTVDVFTRSPFSGNPLAIVESADDLTTAQMQIMAREFNLSETIFVQQPADPANDARVRIFFPTAEIPFAGHPTLGCAIHLAQSRHGQNAIFDVKLTLEEEAGLVLVHVVSSEEGIVATLVAPVIPHLHDGRPPSAQEAAAALGLAPEYIGFDGHANAVHAGGPAFLFIPVNTLEALAGISIQEPFWSRMMMTSNVDSAYVYARSGDGHDYQARMFSPTAGIPEDPATGAATAIFANQLLISGELAQGTTSLTLAQGVEMGRNSELGLEIDLQGETISAVRVSGSSVPVSSGHITIPAA